ncbi:MAG TPA: hypothetical protein GXZ56_07845 [Bacteroidales bacterium]|jgi:hypothetical protein|nr:hypothetical protein [Bacteroidales bacterium]
MRHLLTCLLLFVSLTTYPQKTFKFAGWELSKQIARNEVKVNLVTTIIGLYPELSYERVLSEDFSLGVAAGVSLNGEYPLSYGVMPYTRWFFTGNSQNLQKYGAGFFIEANAGMVSHDFHRANNDSGTPESEDDNELGAGLGLALGWKYLTKNNWIGEIYFGGGRDFVKDSGYPRVGLTIGKRF